MRRMIAAAALVAAAGCATTSGLDPTEWHSGFDGARIVDIVAHGVACTQMTCPAIGAQWSSKTPERALLKVAIVNKTVGVISAELAIDGREMLLEPSPGLTTFSSAGGMLKSEHTFVVSMDTIRSVASAQRAWIRVRTTEGILDDAIVDGPLDSKALYALRRFLAQIDSGPSR